MRILLAMVAMFLGSQAMAGEFVAVGRVEKIVLRPDGSEQCPAACPAGTAEQVANATEQMVCISNSCGCGEAEIAIDKILIGERKPSVLVKYRLGEWCDAEFPIAQPLVLVRFTDSAEPEWSALHPLDNGDYGFESASFTRIGNVEIDTIEAHDGLISLRSLETRLGP